MADEKKINAAFVSIVCPHCGKGSNGWYNFDKPNPKPKRRRAPLVGGEKNPQECITCGKPTINNGRCLSCRAGG